MGTWGSDNFDSDTALDYLAEVCDPLVDKLLKVVENPSLAEADEDGGVEALVAAELLLLVSARYYNPRLTPRLIAECGAIVLSQWEATIDALGPKPDYKVERRQVIHQTFEHLLAAVQHWPPPIDEA